MNVMALLEVSTRYANDLSLSTRIRTPHTPELILAAVFPTSYFEIDPENICVRIPYEGKWQFYIDMYLGQSAL